MIYYIDNALGDDQNSGTKENAPKKSYQELDIKPGDKILFHCGSVYREKLVPVSGTPEAPVTYSSYGEGEQPLFTAYFDIGKPENWVETEKNLWRCTAELPNVTCNLVFDGGEKPASFCFSKENVTAQGFFYDNYIRKAKEEEWEEKQQLVMYSTANPGVFYQDIKWVGANWHLAELKPYVNYENLAFMYSGIHALSGRGQGNLIKNCSFRFIGGARWRVKDTIRFGNAIESWMAADDIEICHCFFDNIYDSCVTHQGSSECANAVNINIHDNLFQNYGMAAYEVRDKMPVNSSFHHNICVNAGEGFSENSVNMPRSSEIWPEPMGHHLFLWRIGDGTGRERLEIKHNLFYNAKYGAAIYARISENAQKSLDIDHNIYYTENKGILNYFYNDNYTSPQEYMKESGHDANSKLEKPDIAAVIRKWKEQRENDYESEV